MQQSPLPVFHRSRHPPVCHRPPSQRRRRVRLHTPKTGLRFKQRQERIRRLCRPRHLRKFASANRVDGTAGCSKDCLVHIQPFTGNFGGQQNHNHQAQKHGSVCNIHYNPTHAHICCQSIYYAGAEFSMTPLIRREQATTVNRRTHTKCKSSARSIRHSGFVAHFELQFPALICLGIDAPQFEDSEFGDRRMKTDGDPWVFGAGISLQSGFNGR